MTENRGLASGLNIAVCVLEKCDGSVDWTLFVVALVVLLGLGGFAIEGWLRRRHR